MVRNLRIGGMFSGNALWAGAAWYLAAYTMMQLLGLSGPPPLGVVRILHTWPALAGFAVLMAGSIARLTTHFQFSRVTNGRSSRSFLPPLIFHCGVLFWGTGILLSSLTRFEGSLILSEGQGMRAVKVEMDPSTVYARKFSRWPDEDLTVLAVAPFFSENGKAAEPLTARIYCKDRRNPRGREVTVGAGIPSLINGFLYRIGERGYSVLFRLFEGSGTIIDQAYAILKIFPPGAEDSFRINQVPHTFYLRYYPDASLAPDRTTTPQGETGPLFKVRVARNLDIVADTYARLDEMIPVDALLLSLGDVRRWVEIVIVRDPGLYLMVPGLIMLIAGGVLIAIHRLRNTGVDGETERADG